MEKRTILITGGTGFLGQNLIKVLNSDYNIYNLGRRSTNLCRNIYWDMKSEIDIASFPNKVDIVIHGGGIVGISDLISTNEYIDINVRSTATLLEICCKKNISHFIYFSTGGVYGYKEGMSYEEDKCNPQDIYSLSKYFSELLCEHYNLKFEVTILRLFFPYGVGQTGRLICNLVNSIMNGDVIKLNIKGLPHINPIYVSDVCEIVKSIINSRVEGTFNISGNEIISIEELCKVIASRLNNRELNFIYTDKKVKDLLGSNRKICDELEYEFRISLKESISEIVDNINTKRGIDFDK